MEPRPFARVSVRALALRLAQPPLDSAATAGSSFHSSSPLTATPSSSSTATQSSPPSSHFCRVKLPNFDPQTVSNIPLVSSSSPSSSSSSSSSSSAASSSYENHGMNQASFYLDEPALAKLFAASSSKFFSSKSPHLSITVYSMVPFPSTSSRPSILSPCYRSYGRIKSCEEALGSFLLPIRLEQLANPKEGVFLHNGWVKLNSKKKRFLSSSLSPSSSSCEIHLVVRAELDPRYIFQFDGQPELNPQIVQVQGKVRQPIFSCKFTCDRSFRARSSRLGSGYYGRESSKEKKERKGWLVLIYDLSGSAVAAASMVTPFVPSTGTDAVGRSNPGAWLIMRADPRGGEDSWMPWGRLEAWREKRGGLGSRFTLLMGHEGMGFGSIGSNACGGALVLESVIDARRGGEFLIDSLKLRPEGLGFASSSSCSPSPVESPQSSGDFCFSLAAANGSCGAAAAAAAAMDCGAGLGFVMSASVDAAGLRRRQPRPPHIELAMRHIGDAEDAAVFMALAAAVDLSVDACLPFSKKLGKSFVSALSTPND